MPPVPPSCSGQTPGIILTPSLQQPGIYAARRRPAPPSLSSPPHHAPLLAADQAPTARDASPAWRPPAGRGRPLGGAWMGVGPGRPLTGGAAGGAGAPGSRELRWSSARRAGGWAGRGRAGRPGRGRGQGWSGRGRWGARGEGGLGTRRGNGRGAAGQAKGRGAGAGVRTLEGAWRGDGGVAWANGACRGCGWRGGAGGGGAGGRAGLGARRPRRRRGAGEGGSVRPPSRAAVWGGCSSSRSA